MTERLVPYRSLTQINADGNIMAVLNTASAIGARLFVGNDNRLVTALSVLFAILGSTLISVSIADWRARHRGAEMISTKELYRRNYIERADRSVWESIGSFALVNSYVVMIILLALLKVEQWFIVPFGTAIGAVFGIVFGVYTWTYARSYTQAASIAEPRQEPTVTPFRQMAMRHYAGYVAGIALGLFLATLFNERNTAVAALFIGFVVGKIASDILVPAVYYGTRQRSTIRQFLLAIPFAIVWWGIPFGVVLAIATHILRPQSDLAAYLVAFGATSVGAIVFSLFILTVSHITQGRSTPAK